MKSALGFIGWTLFWITIGIGIAVAIWEWNHGIGNGLTN